MLSANFKVKLSLIVFYVIVYRERMTAKQCLQHPWLTGRMEKILEISVEETKANSDNPESTNQDTDCESKLTNENSSEGKSANQNLDNSSRTLNKENPEEVLREISKGNVSSERENSSSEEVTKLILCSDILDPPQKEVEGLSSSVCNENGDCVPYTGTDNDDGDDDDNKVSLV